MKATQRKQALHLRNQLTNDEVIVKSECIVAKLKPYLKGNVACYQSYGKEVSLASLALDSFYLPKVMDEHHMQFYKCNHDTLLQKGKHGILEPIDGEPVEVNAIDVIIIPLVAFDDACHRLGHGCGYYDIYLQHCSAFKIGVGFECQKLESIITDTYDVTLDMIISEKQIYKKKCE